MKGLTYTVLPPPPCEYPELVAAIEPLVAMLKAAFDKRATKKANKVLKNIIICKNVLESALNRVRENKPKSVGLALKANGITADVLASCFAKDKANQKRAKMLYGALVTACLPHHLDKEVK